MRFSIFDSENNEWWWIQLIAFIHPLEIYVLFSKFMQHFEYICYCLARKIHINIVWGWAKDLLCFESNSEKLLLQNNKEYPMYLKLNHQWMENMHFWIPCQRIQYTIPKQIPARSLDNFLRWHFIIFIDKCWMLNLFSHLILWHAPFKCFGFISGKLCERFLFVAYLFCLL